MKPTAEDLIKHGVNKKKFSKPLMERRRRARINESLNELKTLVLSSLNKDHSKFNKMEKADVLELTVNYLKSLNSNELQHANDVGQQQHFIAGYNECAREVQMYLLRSNEVSPHVKARVLSHIATPSSEGTARSSMNYTNKRDETVFSTTSSFSPVVSVYPSPPASPIGLAHNRIGLKSPKESHEISCTSLTTDRSRTLNVEKKDEKRAINNVNQELWRPWLSI